MYVVTVATETQVRCFVTLGSSDPLESRLLALRLLALGLVVLVCADPENGPSREVIRQSPYTTTYIDFLLELSTYVSIDFLSVIKTRDTFKFHTFYFERYPFFLKM